MLRYFNIFLIIMLAQVFLARGFVRTANKALSQNIARIMKIKGGSTQKLASAHISTEKSSDIAFQKLQKLRYLMEKEQIDAFIIPTEDPHMSEYTPLFYNRREFISGFTGSAGTALVMKDQAVLFTDGRYHNQASLELNGDYWTLMKQGIKGVPTLLEYLKNTLSPGSTIGIDPWVHNAGAVKSLCKALEEKHISLKILSYNLIDMIWESNDRVPLAKDPIRIHDIAYAGVNVTRKLELVRASMNSSGTHALVITSLDEVAWLYNLRGSDVPCNPVFVSYALVTTDSAFLFIDETKVPQNVLHTLHATNISVLPYQLILPKLNEVVSHSPKQKVFTDPKSINYALFSAIPEDQRHESESPIIGLKAIKNEAELAGMLACHIRDGAAVVEFLAWLDEVYTTTAPPIDEYDIDIVLTEKRKSMSPTGSFVDRSFPTIAGVDSNGAIIHYRASKEKCKVLTSNSLLLLDSGAQYLDGTTDVTRTFHMGEPSSYQVEMFTRVLKGHIAIDRCVFPAGTPGCLLDTYAREHLWRVGKDFIHGVGHGVGAALNVHEGPQKISPLLDGHALIPGMIISNEPGYYEDGNFGIRIENLLIVTEKADVPEFRGRKFYGFDRLTHIPIQKKLMNKSMMSQDEIDWVNHYHNEVRERVMPLLETERAKNWLKEATGEL